MTKLVNRAKMTTATTGTGAISLSGAVDGYQTFADAGVANADVVRYVIEDGDAWEIGLGTYSTTGTTLTRGSIESSNADNPINLTGNAVVYVSAAAADLQELVDFADNFVLPTADGSTGQVLTTNGAGTLSFTTITGYTDADVDTHLNTGTAASGEVLSWNGSDYDWITSGGAFSVVGTNNLAGITTLPDITTGTDNFAAGNNAGVNLTTGSNNVALGNGALDAATTGGRNIAIGQDAMGLGNATQASGDNIAIGYQAGYDLTSALGNVLVGQGAGANITSGANNTAVGNFAISFGQNMSGGNNVSVGAYSGLDLTTGASNAMVGRSAGANITTGVGNTMLGHSAGDLLTTGGNNIVLGNGSDASSATVSNEITLGNSSITRFRVPGAGIDNTSAALSGTTPSVDVGARDTYTLTTSGNTTFTFTGAPSSGQVGTFSLIITAGGTHTLTWPASVDWAGGSAPDAPASGEVDVYTFMTVDGGTTWYGFLAGDAMA